MLDADSRRAADQAQRLREIAGGQEPVAPVPLVHSGPHCVLVAEFPAQGRGGPLAWFLAEELARRLRRQRPGAKSLLVDLTPAGSRMDRMLAFSGNDKRQGAPTFQPLWQCTSHGRVLSEWTPKPHNALDVLAQVHGELPTSDQYLRITEQLVRHLASRSHWGAYGYESVTMLALAEGVALDQACWSAADDIIILWSPALIAWEQLQIQLQARLPQRLSGQRLSCLYPVNAPLFPWLSARRGKPVAAGAAVAGATTLAGGAGGDWQAEWTMPLPAWPRTSFSMSLYRRAARRIAARIHCLALDQIFSRSESGATSTVAANLTGT
ncbi:MAG: hypothetical protein KatS3mg111_0518 [Pirellulaceae bacterium]|nr:MAG: hypothetical protein KatS3mg111_0518 [Pirellulaceae bacterium]